MTNYPSISDYRVALERAEDTLDELRHLRLVWQTDDTPVTSRGHFAVVFKMQDPKTERYYALKCFLREEDGRSDRYRLISEALADVHSPYLANIRYLENEIFVDVSGVGEALALPVLLMDWVEGVSLAEYIKWNISNPYTLSCSLSSFLS